MKKLPIFEGYTVDVRLKQFRKVKGIKIKFINFDSEKGENILNKYIKSLNKKSKEFKELIKHF
ncbi:hypothetical protein KY312_03130 [Candidatus Woesearchaeota archaeon]|nr:hypothetical protein [Candidatus Woesearchaeota archaeon]